MKTWAHGAALARLDTPPTGENRHARLRASLTTIEAMNLLEDRKLWSKHFGPDPTFVQQT